MAQTHTPISTQQALWKGVRTCPSPSASAGPSQRPPAAAGRFPHQRARSAATASPGTTTAWCGRGRSEGSPQQPLLQLTPTSSACPLRGPWHYPVCSPSASSSLPLSPPIPVRFALLFCQTTCFRKAFSLLHPLPLAAAGPGLLASLLLSSPDIFPAAPGVLC